ncbi:hypothetical protein ACHAQJ_004435 [Trichoderma viride]
MIPLDFPMMYTTDEPSTGIEPSDPAVESSSLSAFRLEHYLAEEHRHDRVALGIPPLGVNKATVKRYLPEVIQNMDSNASQVDATRGTMTESDERGCQGSFSTLASTTSDGSLEPIGAYNNNGSDYLAGAADTTSCSDQHMPPSLAGLGKTDMTPIKSEHALASSESHHMGSDTCEQDIELERFLIHHHKTSGRNRRERWRVGKQARVRKIIRQRKRSEEPGKEVTK